MKPLKVQVDIVQGPLVSQLLSTHALTVEYEKGHSAFTSKTKVGCYHSYCLSSFHLLRFSDTSSIIPLLQDSTRRWQLWMARCVSWPSHLLVSLFVCLFACCLLCRCQSPVVVVVLLPMRNPAIPSKDAPQRRTTHRQHLFSPPPLPTL